MRRDRILEFTRRVPFQPFEIQLVDGTIFTIRHPEQIVTDSFTARVGISQVDRMDREKYDDHVIVTLLHIGILRPYVPPPRSDGLEDQI